MTEASLSVDNSIFLEAAEIVEDRCSSSQTLDVEAFNALPRFEKEEISVGKLLGKGGFCTVCEVKRVTLRDEPNPVPTKGKNKGSRDEHDDDDDLPGAFSSCIVQDRNYMATRYLRHGKDARYAVKTLSHETTQSSEKYLAGVVDLAIEAKFLSVIRHPNIIKMRAMAKNGPFEPGFFIVLDRLYDILPERLNKWSRRRNMIKGIGKVLDIRKSKKKQLKLERLLVCMDLSSALAYLHSHNILYRDLKPDNIGFDVRGDVKLFDFGLSFEITDDLSPINGLYELSGNTGSLRYMAPEVALGNPYNHKVDVYSFGILFWQIMTLKTPFEGHSVSVQRNEVVLGSKRPPFEGSVWTLQLMNLISCCWSADVTMRPEFADVVSVIREEATALEDENMGDSHSTVFDRSRHTERSL